MTLYNMLHGKNGASPIILAMVGYTEETMPRFRDAWIEKAEDGSMEIHVYTRMGGGNAEHWDFSYPDDSEGPECPCPSCRMEYEVYLHSHHLRHADDDFDYTYRTVVFSVPDRWKVIAEGLVQDKVDTDARWAEALAKIEKGETAPEVEEALGQVMAQLQEAVESGESKVITWPEVER
jgi:hypothetical protein